MAKFVLPIQVKKVVGVVKTLPASTVNTSDLSAVKAKDFSTMTSDELSAMFQEAVDNDRDLAMAEMIKAPFFKANLNTIDKEDILANVAATAKPEIFTLIINNLDFLAGISKEAREKLLADAAASNPSGFAEIMKSAALKSVVGKEEIAGTFSSAAKTGTQATLKLVVEDDILLAGMTKKQMDAFVYTVAVNGDLNAIKQVVEGIKVLVKADPEVQHRFAIHAAKNADLVTLNYLDTAGILGGMSQDQQHQAFIHAISQGKRTSVAFLIGKGFMTGLSAENANWALMEVTRKGYLTTAQDMVGDAAFMALVTNAGAGQALKEASSSQAAMVTFLTGDAGFMAKVSDADISSAIARSAGSQDLALFQAYMLGYKAKLTADDTGQALANAAGQDDLVIMGEMKTEGLFASVSATYAGRAVMNSVKTLAILQYLDTEGFLAAASNANKAQAIIQSENYLSSLQLLLGKGYSTHLSNSDVKYLLAMVSSGTDIDELKELLADATYMGKLAKTDIDGEVKDNLTRVVTKPNCVKYCLDGSDKITSGASVKCSTINFGSDPMKWGEIDSVNTGQADTDPTTCFVANSNPTSTDENHLEIMGQLAAYREGGLTDPYTAGPI